MVPVAFGAVGFAPCERRVRTRELWLSMQAMWRSMVRLEAGVVAVGDGVDVMLLSMVC